MRAESFHAAYAEARAPGTFRTLRTALTRRARLDAQCRVCSAAFGRASPAACKQLEWLARPELTLHLLAPVLLPVLCRPLRLPHKAAARAGVSFPGPPGQHKTQLRIDEADAEEALASGGLTRTDLRAGPSGTLSPTRIKQVLATSTLMERAHGVSAQSAERQSEAAPPESPVESKVSAAPQVLAYCSVERAEGVARLHQSLAFATGVQGQEPQGVETAPADDRSGLSGRPAPMLRLETNDSIFGPGNLTADQVTPIGSCRQSGQLRLCLPASFNDRAPSGGRMAARPAPHRLR